MKETWRQQMQQKLADYEEPAPELSWEEIEQAVAQKQRPKLIPLWSQRIAAAAAVLLIGGAAVLYLRQRESVPESEMPTAAAPSIETPSIATPQQPAEKPQQNILQKMVCRMRQHNQTAITPPTQTVAIEPEAEPVQQQEASADAPVDTTTAESPREEIRHPATQTQQPYTQYNTHTPKPNSSPKLLTAKLFYSNSIAGGQTLISYASPYSMIQNDPTNQNKSESTGKGEKSSNENADLQQSEQVSHRQPIRFGLLLRYQLSKRWALESGLTYTRLTAEITRRVPGIVATTTDQSLNYIGIPLTANYLIYNSRHFGVYASGGMMVEKMVYGSRTDSGSRQSVSIHPLQLSLHTSLGAEYHFIPALSIFVEPGLGYYFDNGSSIPTFYQEKPLSFNLNLGLRFSFE